MRKIVGITEKHGIAQEYSKFPPDGYDYRFVDTKPNPYSKLFPSTAKRFFYTAEDDGVDLVEAPIFPAHTHKPWIYTPAEFSGTANFSFLHCPLPRKIKLKMIESVFKRENFKNIVFKSHAGLKTFNTYAGKVDADIQRKSRVVYPCVTPRELRTNLKKDDFTILFVGDFFRKGGANVVDAFIELHKAHPYLHLKIIGNTELDTNNQSLKQEYQQKINSHNAITHTRVSRDELLNDIYPTADIFVSPTYQETFGFAILEAMSFGLPVISTAHFAIPEIIDNKKDGILIDTEQFNFIREFRGYEVNNIPKEFSSYLTEKVYENIDFLVRSEEARGNLSLAALRKVKTKFSPQKRADDMKQLYDNALS
ncbi:glycosyltransferase family 4 protein [Alteromonas sp. H39]|uniref:glycosyltransferase family 4 protein n=1 Tax=Alteromonas sp. H39 TaxID=3389876 RepID=UPI0039E1BABE